MSTEQSVDPELVEETKQQIRNLVREIAQLSKTQLAPLEYYDAFLNRVVSALAAVGGAIWTLGDDGRLELEYQINIQETGLAGSQEDQARHGRLLRKALTAGQGMLVAPQSGAGEEDEGGNPTDFLVVLGPLKTDQQMHGLIEIFQRPGSSPNVQRGYLRFLLQMCELASDFLKSRQLRHFTDRQTLWSQLENFTRVAHVSLDPRATAYTIANEGRRLIECDRVSVGICRGKKCRIEAVSGQDLFDRRSNTVSLLSRLATAVIATGEPIWYTGDTTYMAPQVEEAVQAYVDESHSKAVGVIPLARPVEDADDKRPPEVIGALIIEQIEDSRPKEGLLQRVEVVKEHSQTALANAIEHNSLFLMPVWRAIGRAKWVVQARTLPKTIAISSVVVALLLALFLWPADFELEGKGTLQPVKRAEVFAPQVEGTIDEVLVVHGQKVKKGQLLARMQNTDLSVKLNSVLGERNTANEQRTHAQRQLQENKALSPSDKIRLNGELIRLRATISGLHRQIELLEKKRELLNVVSPIDGEIVTWKVEELLKGRSVQPGQILMSVADPTGDWELEVHMPEHRMGHIAQARKEVQKQQGKDLSVTYIVATDPGHPHKGQVKVVEAKAEPKGEEGNVVLIQVDINKDDLAYRRPGAQVTAKVDCGRASIGYVWFHDLISFVQSKILFRL